jgi:hypothetical protein
VRCRDEISQDLWPAIRSDEPTADRSGRPARPSPERTPCAAPAGADGVRIPRTFMIPASACQNDTRPAARDHLPCVVGVAAAQVTRVDLAGATRDDSTSVERLRRLIAGRQRLGCLRRGCRPARDATETDVDDYTERGSLGRLRDAARKRGAPLTAEPGGTASSPSHRHVDAPGLRTGRHTGREARPKTARSLGQDRAAGRNRPPGPCPPQSNA